MYNQSYDSAAYRMGTSSVSFPAVMKNVYLWMTLALAMTGLTAAAVATQPQILMAIITNRLLFWGLMLAELGLVFYFSARVMQMSLTTAGIVFAAYSVLNGLTLSYIFMAYTMQSIATTFFVTAGTFGAMSLVGLFIKRDLSAIGRFLFMALIGLIIATLVNMFLQSSGLSWALTYVGVLIFCGLTAYDTQKMKIILSQGDAADEGMMKIALMCSLSLYLDFINLFLYLLRIFGDRK